MTSNVICHKSFKLISEANICENGVSRSSMVLQEPLITTNGDVLNIKNVKRKISVESRVAPPRLGLLFIGICGNNGTTMAAAMIANKFGMRYETIDGIQEPNWLGSVALSATMPLGVNENSELVYAPVKSLVNFVRPDDIVLGGWDVTTPDMIASMKQAKVIPLDLQRQVKEELQKIDVMPGYYTQGYMAENQVERVGYAKLITADTNPVELLRRDIQKFTHKHALEKVIVVWSANTESMNDLTDMEASTLDELIADVKLIRSLPASMAYAIASIAEGCDFINASPQNTINPLLIRLARDKGCLLAGNDLKTGQTKYKSVITDYLISSGIKPISIVSYNHLGNNDGKNLSEAKTFASKESSKSNVIDDMLESNTILYEHGEHPDHVIVIKYVPAVADSKRALDEYTSNILLSGKQTIVTHNTCEDSLLAAPILLDLVLFMELITRCTVTIDDIPQKHATLNTWLSLFLKAPQVPAGTPVINSFYDQRDALLNFVRLIAGIAPQDNLRIFQRLENQ